MNATASAATKQPTWIPISEALTDCLRLPRQAVVKLGAPAQTLAAVARMAGDRGRKSASEKVSPKVATPNEQPREQAASLFGVSHTLVDRGTFARLEIIAAMSCEPVRNVRRHLATLVAFDWLRKGPRTKTRRTPTYALTAEARGVASPYLLLPRWGAANLTTWGERALLAFAVSQFQFVDSLDPDGGGALYNRAFFSLRSAHRLTGVSLPTLRNAKQSLLRLRLLTLADMCDELALADETGIPRGWIPADPLRG